MLRRVLQVDWRVLLVTGFQAELCCSRNDEFTRVQREAHRRGLA
jgi:hypothetical protein